MPILAFVKKGTKGKDMKIRDLFQKNRFSLSFEIFPPKREGSLEPLYRTVGELLPCRPHFISVTYGAGGSTRHKTVEISEHIKNELKQEVLAHLTCVESTRRDIDAILAELADRGIENVLALRGDPPKGEEVFVRPEGGFGYANELVEFIHGMGRFCIGVAGYPEGHPEAPSLEKDMDNLKRKVDAGADFVITQLFFVNDHYYRFRDRALGAGIGVPLIPGVFPIFNFSQIARMTSLCGAEIPPRLFEKLDRISEKPEEVEKYGIDYAVRQTDDLLGNGIPGIHYYSMNRSDHILRILGSLSLPERFSGEEKESR